jgi:hypothetical protein
MTSAWAIEIVFRKGGRRAHLALLDDHASARSMIRRDEDREAGEDVAYGLNERGRQAPREA